jgi:hypothetical protein
VIAASLRARQKTSNPKLEPEIPETEPEIPETRISFGNFGWQLVKPEFIGT